MAVEKQINEHIVKTAAHDDYQMPTKAFVTFVNQKHHEKMANNFESKKNRIGKPIFQKEGEGHIFRLFGQPVELYEAPEPSNITWANQ